MKVNTGRSHLLLLGNSRAMTAIDNCYIESKYKQVSLAIIIYSNHTFENHINIICNKASQKLNALARITPYMSLQKRRTIIKSFVTSQFSYCPLIFMFRSRRLNNKINSMHQRNLSPEILREIFVSRTSSQNLCRNDTFGNRLVHPVYNGTESLSFLLYIYLHLSLYIYIVYSSIICSLLVNLSHTDESWERRNTCLWIYTL